MLSVAPSKKKNPRFPKICHVFCGKPLLSVSFCGKVLSRVKFYLALWKNLFLRGAKGPRRALNVVDWFSV